MTCPSPSLTFKTLTSIVSPTLRTVVRSVLDSFVYSFLDKIPSDLYPILRMASSGFTSIIVPSTISPLLILLFFSKDSSSICSNVRSDIVLNLLNDFLWGGSPRGDTYKINPPVFKMIFVFFLKIINIADK